MTTAIHKPSAPKKVLKKENKNDRDIGAGDLQDMDFETFSIDSEIMGSRLSEKGALFQMATENNFKELLGEIVR